MKKFRMILLILISCIFFVAGTSSAAPFTSHALVDQNFNSSWEESTLSGTARYFLYIDEADVSVNELLIEFESDIFNLSELDAGDFTVLNPTGWDTTIYTTGTAYKWGISSAGSVATRANDPIIVDVNYTLLSADRFLNASGSDWGWDEGQAWEQAYEMFGFTSSDGADFRSTGGSIAPVPEPATMLLLGTGLIGLAGASRKRLFNN